jgi:hypothetical protein
VAAELPGFKTFERLGIGLSAGQSAVIDIVLGVGEVSEVVSVTADAPVVDLGRIDQGRTLNEREIKELPLTSRNPYNFALLQPGVVGFETQEFGVPRRWARRSSRRLRCVPRADGFFDLHVVLPAAGGAEVRVDRGGRVS